MKLTYTIWFWIYFNATVGQEYHIIGGRLAKVGEFPYQVSIRRSHDGAHICGGTIISPRFVLSAGHCFDKRQPPSYYIVIAGQLTHPITNSSICRNVSRIIPHKHNFLLIFNDIALLELETNLPVNSTLISTIALNKESISSGTCTITGWGYLGRDGPISDSLMSAEVYIITNKECRKSYIVIPLPGMICAGHPNGTTDSCSGDSGGPLVCNGLLVGIISGGRKCASNHPGFYTNVAYYLSWIEEETSIRFS